MIESAFGYKFRDHINETILYEDQLVEHGLTGYIAQRRVFPKRLVQDEVAFEAIKDQVRLSTTISHPNVPSILNAGMHDGQYLLIQQNFQGETLELIAQRKHAQTAKDWAAIARRLVRMFSSLQLNGIAFDRISLADVIYTNQLILVGSRYPVGVTGEKALEKSPFLQRLFESTTSGIYHVQGRFPVAECLEATKNLLFQLSCSKQYESVDKALDVQLERMRTSGQTKLYSALGIEHAIEEVILRLHNQKDSNAIRSLEELTVALDKMDVNKSRPKEMPIGMRQVEPEAMNTAHSFAPDFDDSTSQRSASSSKVSPPKAFVPPVVNPTPRTSEFKKEASDYGATGGTKQMIGHDTHEDAEEDRSYLYPSKPSSESTSSVSNKKPSNDSIASGDTISAPAPRKSISIPVVPILIGVAVLVVVGVAASILPALMKKENNPPTAVIDAPAGTVTKATVPLILNGKNSSDPDENTNLTYTWFVPKGQLDTTDYILKQTDSTGSEVSISIFKPGSYTVELVVFDGSLKSAPQEITLTVESGI